MSGIFFPPSVAAQSYTCSACLKMFKELIFKTSLLLALLGRYSLSPDSGEAGSHNLAGRIEETHPRTASWTCSRSSGWVFISITSTDLTHLPDPRESRRPVLSHDPNLTNSPGICRSGWSVWGEARTLHL